MTKIQNPIDTAQIVREVMPQIHAQLVQRVVDSLAGDVYAEAEKAIADDIKNFIDAEITPALKAALSEKKDEIIAALAAEVGKVGPKMAEKMATKAAETLGSDYKFRSILKELFGGY